MPSGARAKQHFQQWQLFPIAHRQPKLLCPNPHQPIRPAEFHLPAPPSPSPNRQLPTTGLRLPHPTPPATKPQSPQRPPTPNLSRPHSIGPLLPQPLLRHPQRSLPPPPTPSRPCIPPKRLAHTQSQPYLPQPATILPERPYNLPPTEHLHAYPEQTPTNAPVCASKICSNG